MSFDWSEYLKLARALVGKAVRQANREARLRAAISRAYYAAFCKCRNYLRDYKGHTIPIGGRAHQYVQNEFKKSLDRVRKRIGYNLERLRSDRNKADYEDSIGMADSMAKVDLALADSVIVALSKL